MQTKGLRLRTSAQTPTIRATAIRWRNTLKAAAASRRVVDWRADNASDNAILCDSFTRTKPCARSCSPPLLQFRTRRALVLAGRTLIATP